VAGGKWCLEEATPNHLRAGRPYGPRRCGGPEHSAGYLVESAKNPHPGRRDRFPLDGRGSKR